MWNEEFGRPGFESLVWYWLSHSPWKYVVWKHHIREQNFIVLHYFWQNVSRRPVKQDREPMADQCMTTSKIPPVNQWVLLGSLIRIWVKSHVQEQKWLNHSCTKNIPQQVTFTKAENLEYIAQSPGRSSGWDSALLASFIWSEPLLGSLAGLCFF